MNFLVSKLLAIIQMITNFHDLLFITIFELCSSCLEKFEFIFYFLSDEKLLTKLAENFTECRGRTVYC